MREEGRSDSKGSVRGEFLISSSFFTILGLEVLDTNILLRRLTFYKAGESNWPSVKNTLKDIPLLT